MSFSRALIAILLLLAPGYALAQGQVRTTIKKPASSAPAPKVTNYTPPRPAFAGLRLMMPADSARMIMKKIALRQTTHQIDSMTMIESDSIRLYGQSAYIQLQIINDRIRTIVINFHPLAGDRYFQTRDNIKHYMEQHLGRGVVMTNESVTYRRWTTEDGQMEVSHSDKYYRVFIRLGKNPLT
ncbi:MAG TPA: hypothetical protein VFH43_07400 [Candidatus Kapabacteria bacterium]|nr:hypothetical protein [Candidatus Kapabacteria bacterium]